MQSNSGHRDLSPGTLTATLTETIYLARIAPKAWQNASRWTGFRANDGSRRLARTLIFCLALLYANPAHAAWFDPAWQFRKAITINSTQVAANLTDFPVLVSITDADLAAKARSDGFDILFTDDDETTKLDHEIEDYDAATGTLIAWVKVPNLPASVDKTIYLYYGNPGAPDQQNAAAVWSNGYEAVYHLNDDFLDSTPNARNATNNGSVDIAGNGNTADGQDFTPIDELRLSTWSVSGTAITMQAWARFDDFAQDDPRILSKAQGGATQDHVFMLALGGAGEQFPRMRIKTGTSDTSGTTTLVASTGALTVNTWHLVAGSYDGSAMRLFRDGTQVASTGKTGALRINAWEIWAGNNPNNTTDTTWASMDGKLDEIRISSVPRSANWLSTEYNNQDDPALFYTLGAEEPSPITAERILLVVPNAGSLSAQDAAKKTLIESWGYTVVLISASDSQANFDAAVTTSDAAYVSEEISSGVLGTKLRAATIGVINEERLLTDEFGISSSRLGYTSSAIEIVNTAHYITSPFPTGVLTITTSGQPFMTVSGTIAPGIQGLAQQPAASGRTLAVIDTGGALSDGGTAAACRVQLPWGGGAFDINSLNASGLLVMRRAIEWAIPCTPAPPGADLDLIKTDSADFVVVSDPFTYTLTVANNGPINATNVILVDTLPAGVAFRSASPSQGSCVHSGEPLGGTVTCTLGVITNGANATVNIDVDAPASTGVINNLATVSADETDPDPTDNTANETTTIVGPPGPPVCQVDPTGTYIEAENFTDTIVQGTAFFTVESSQTGFNGSGYLLSNGGGSGGSPVDEGKIYGIEFTTSGVYNVWMRGYATSGSTDSLFIGLNGTSVGALNEGGTFDVWVWTNSIQVGGNQITVPAAGFHDFNAWIRENGHLVDGFYLTQGGETPTAGIPPGVPTLDPVACAAPELVMMKIVATLSDPVNGTTNPKAIPGATVLYTIQLTNQGPGTVDADTVVISETLPPELELFVNDLGGPGSGPALFVDGAPVSGLTYTFGGLGNGTDDLSFDDGSLTFTYTPVPDVDGYDANVTAVRINPKGILNAAGAGGDPFFELRFQARVR